VSPTAAVRRARKGHGGAGAHERAVELDTVGPLGEADGDADKAGIGDKQVGAATDHQHRQVVATDDFGDSAQFVERLGRDEDRR
jgi:hypothetical protein